MSLLSNVKMFAITPLILSCALALLSRAAVGSAIYSRKANRMENGVPAAPDQFPFQVMINTTSTYQNVTYIQHTCTGTILNERWILTSATCVAWNPQSALSLELGAQHLKGDGIRYDIEQIIVHPEFAGTIKLNNHNIALIQTNRTIEFGKQIRPIRLSTINVGENYEAQFSGWVGYFFRFFLVCFRSELNLFVIHFAGG